MKEKLTEDFIIELLKCCLSDKRVLETCISVLKFNYINEPDVKEVWKEIKDYYNLQASIPSIGILTEAFKSDRGARSIVSTIKSTLKPDTADMMRALQDFIQRNMFVEAHGKVSDLYEKGNLEGSYDLGIKLFQEVRDFNLLEVTLREKLFGDYESRNVEREERAIQRESHSEETYIPKIGIDEVDYYLKGRLVKGDFIGFVAQSGVGKSTILRWLGIVNATSGGIVVHFQGEDSKRLCADLYDTAWTNSDFDNLSNGKLTDSQVKAIVKASKKNASKGGELYIEAFEKFGSGSISNCIKILEEIELEVGRIDVIIWDYLEKFELGDGSHYKKDADGEGLRRHALADKMKNICLHFNALGVTATQASNVKSELLENPEFVMTRDHISRVKALIDPFTAFFTLNQTADEYENEIIRLSFEKFRKSKGRQVITIAQNREKGRFYDRNRTLNHFWDAENNMKR